MQRSRVFMAVIGAAMLMGLGPGTPAASAQGIPCTLNTFLAFGFQACPPGASVNPLGFPVTPQGIMLPQQSLIVTPTGQVINLQGQEVSSHGDLVSCVAHQAPRGEGEHHGQIVSAIARGDDDGPFDDPETAAILTQCLADLGNPVLVSPGTLPVGFPNQGRGNDDDGDGPGRGAGNQNRGGPQGNPGRGPNHGGNGRAH
jgi:hypothetical protein